MTTDDQFVARLIDRVIDAALNRLPDPDDADDLTRWANKHRVTKDGLGPLMTVIRRELQMVVVCKPKADVADGDAR